MPRQRGLPALTLPHPICTVLPAAGASVLSPLHRAHLSAAARERHVTSTPGLWADARQRGPRGLLAWPGLWLWPLRLHFRGLRLAARLHVPRARAAGLGPFSRGQRSVAEPAPRAGLCPGLRPVPGQPGGARWGRSLHPGARHATQQGWREGEDLGPPW